jgi:hypothetical protein
VSGETRVSVRVQRIKRRGGVSIVLRCLDTSTMVIWMAVLDISRTFFHHYDATAVISTGDAGGECSVLAPRTGEMGMCRGGTATRDGGSTTQPREHEIFSAGAGRERSDARARVFF